MSKSKSRKSLTPLWRRTVPHGCYQTTTLSRSSTKPTLLGTVIRQVRLLVSRTPGVYREDKTDPHPVSQMQGERKMMQVDGQRTRTCTDHGPPKSLSPRATGFCCMCEAKYRLCRTCFAEGVDVSSMFWEPCETVIRLEIRLFQCGPTSATIQMVSECWTTR